MGVTADNSIRRGAGLNGLAGCVCGSGRGMVVGGRGFTTYSGPSVTVTDVMENMKFQKWTALLEFMHT